MRLRNRERVSTEVGDWLLPGLPLVSVAVSGASSDVVTSIGGDLFRVVTWTSSGSITPASAIDVEYLVVAGGGGGGTSSGSVAGAGGGGAGGVRHNVGGSLQTVSAVQTVTVGAGGAGGANGSASSLGSLVATVGGGQGGNQNTGAGSVGGSGGGGASGVGTGAAGGAGTAGEGNAGGDGQSTSGNRGGGGGGGASAVGATGTTTVAGNGGDGVSVAITGTSVTYGGGGGGGHTLTDLSLIGFGGAGGGGNGSTNVGDKTPTAGTDGLGGGGGGAGRNAVTSAAGGDGVVVVRWKLSSFTPLQLLPALWLDASDTSTITEVGGAVSQWDDKSGNGRHVTQAIAANQPTTGTATVNGRNVINFDGSNDELTHDAGSDAITMAPLSYAIVAYDNNSTQSAVSYRRVFATRRSATGAADFQAPNSYFYKTNTARSIRGAGNAKEVGPVTYTNQQPFVVWGRFTATEASIAVNGGSLSTSAVDAAIGLQRYLRVGNAMLSSGNPPGTSADTFWGGYVCEIVLVNADLSANDLGLLRDYLRAKWGTG